MIGPDHYILADTLIKEATQTEMSLEWVAAVTALAQVHATMALAAATAQGNISGFVEPDERSAWKSAGAW